MWSIARYAQNARVVIDTQFTRDRQFDLWRAYFALSIRLIVKKPLVSTFAFQFMALFCSLAWESTKNLPGTSFCRISALFTCIYN